MTISELKKEFIFDCEVRELSAKTTHNYDKQLKHFENFLRGTCGVESLEELKPIHIKQFVAMLQKRGSLKRKAQLSAKSGHAASLIRKDTC